MEVETERELAAEIERADEERFLGPWASLTSVITAPKQEETDAPAETAGPEPASGPGGFGASPGRRMRAIVIVAEIFLAEEERPVVESEGEVDHRPPPMNREEIKVPLSSTTMM